MHSCILSSARRCIVAGLFVASAAIASAAIERKVEKAFAVSGAGTLHVEIQGGGIRVVASEEPTVTVTVRQKIRANSESEADELLKHLELKLEQDGNDVRVVSRYEGKRSFLNFGSWPPVSVDVTVSVPATFSTDLNTSGGSVVVGDLTGRVNARTSGGSITLGRMGGPVHARTSGGNITLDSASGPVELGTSGGNIAVGRVAAAAKLSTSGGNIRIDASTNALRAHTSGGNIRAAIIGPLTEDCSLSTSGGSVRVGVDKSAAFRLDASTSGGGVDVEGLSLTLENVTSNRSRLAGDVNGGGPLLKVRSSGGGVVVRAN